MPIDKQMIVTCGYSSGRGHSHLAIALTAALDPAEAGRVHAEIDGLAAQLDSLWRLAPRAQLAGCAAAMAQRFRVCDDRSLEDLLLHDVLARRVGHPLVLALIAADAGRRAGLPVGLVGIDGAQHLAHVVLPEPVVADPRQAFVLTDIRGREQGVRWSDPVELAGTLLELIADAARRAGDIERAGQAAEALLALP